MLTLKKDLMKKYTAAKKVKGKGSSQSKREEHEGIKKHLDQEG